MPETERTKTTSCLHHLVRGKSPNELEYNENSLMTSPYKEVWKREITSDSISLWESGSPES